MLVSHIKLVRAQALGPSFIAFPTALKDKLKAEKLEPTSPQTWDAGVKSQGLTYRRCWCWDRINKDTEISSKFFMFVKNELWLKHLSN